jgi:ligand-binding sensor domain-containing protein
LLLTCPAWAQQPRLIGVNPHLPDNQRPDKLFAATDGYLWLAKDLSLYRFNGLQAQPIHFVQANEAPVTAFVQFNGENWVGNAAGSLYIQKNEGFKRFKPEEGLPQAAISGLVSDNNKQLWIATKGEGVYCWTGRRLYHFGKEDGLPDLYISDLKFWNHAIWVATDGGLVRLTFEKGKKSVQSYNRAHGLPDLLITSLLTQGDSLILGFQDASPGFWTVANEYNALPFQQMEGVKLMTRMGDELWWLNHEQQLFVYDFIHQQGRKLNLGSIAGKNRLQQWISDANGQQWWLGNQGLYRHNPALMYWTIPQQGVQAVLADRHQRLWYSTHQGLFYLDANGNSQSYPLYPAGSNIISLFEDAKGQLWAGSFGQGLWRIAANRLQQQHLLLDNNNIFSITEKNDSLFLATLGGVYASSNVQGNYHFSILSQGNTGQAYVYQLLVDAGKRLLAATDGKGILLDNQSIPTSKEKLNSVISMTFDDQQNLWLSSPQNGLYKYKNQQWQSFPAMSEEIVGMGYLQQQLCLVHRDGITLYFPKSQQWRRFHQLHGLPMYEPYTNALYQGKNEILIGGQHEIIRLRSLENQQGVQLKLEAVRLAGQAHDSSLHRINPGDLPLSFHFDALYADDPEAVEFRFKINGYGKEWIRTRNRELILPKLGAGQYSLVLQASTHPDFLHAPTLYWQFEILPPLYLRWWFVTTSLFILALITILIVKNREKRLKRLADLQKESIAAQLETLKSQVSPHFLFNSFNTLMALIETDAAKAAHYLEKLSDFYRHLLQYRETELISLEEEIGLVETYAYLQQQRFGEHFRLEIELNENVRKSLIPPLCLQLLVENAIKHNQINQKNPLAVYIGQEGNFLVVKNKTVPKSFPEISTGFGLKSLVERYRLLSPQAVEIKALPNSFSVYLPILTQYENSPA